MSDRQARAAGRSTAGSVFAHPLFLAQVESAGRAGRGAQAKDPAGYAKKSASKRLAAIAKLAFDVIPQDPARPEYRQGDTLGDEHKHWFRAKFFQQYRLFFRYHAPRQGDRVRLGQRRGHETRLRERRRRLPGVPPDARQRPSAVGLGPVAGRSPCRGATTTCLPQPSPVRLAESSPVQSDGGSRQGLLQHDRFIWRPGGLPNSFSYYPERRSLLPVGVHRSIGRRDRPDKKRNRARVTRFIAGCGAVRSRGPAENRERNRSVSAPGRLPSTGWRSTRRRANRANTGETGKNQPIRVGILIGGGDEEDRTPDLRIANAALSQLAATSPRSRRCSRRGVQRNWRAAAAGALAAAAHGYRRLIEMGPGHMDQLIALIQEHRLSLVFANVLARAGGRADSCVSDAHHRRRVPHRRRIPRCCHSCLVGALAAVIAGTFCVSRRPPVRHAGAPKLCRILSLSPDSCVRQTETIFERFGPHRWYLRGSCPDSRRSDRARRCASACATGNSFCSTSSARCCVVGVAVAIGMSFATRSASARKALQSLGRWGSCSSSRRSPRRSQRSGGGASCSSSSCGWIA